MKFVIIKTTQPTSVTPSRWTLTRSCNLYIAELLLHLINSQNWSTPFSPNWSHSLAPFLWYVGGHVGVGGECWARRKLDDVLLYERQTETLLTSKNYLLNWRTSDVWFKKDQKNDLIENEDVALQHHRYHTQQINKEKDALWGVFVNWEAVAETLTTSLVIIGSLCAVHVSEAAGAMRF